MRWSVEDYSKKSDSELAALSQRGEASATEILLDRYKNAVRRCARRFALGAGVETDDLVQEGMIGLYTAVLRFSPEGGKSFKNFVYLCVERRIYTYLRSMRREPQEAVDPEEVCASGSSPEDLLIGSETDAELRLRLMHSLSDFEFRVMTMYLEGLSYADISEATKKPVKSIDNALSRAKKKLQKEFS